MSGWLDPYLAPSPASRLAGMFDLSGVGSFVDAAARGASFAAFPFIDAPMPAAPPPPPPRVLPRPASAPAPAVASSPLVSTSSPSLAFGGSRTMAVDLNSVVAAVNTIGDKVVAFKKADADANLSRARIEADARLAEVAYRSRSGAVLPSGVGGVLGSLLPWLGLGLGAVVLLKVVKAVR